MTYLKTVSTAILNMDKKQDNSGVEPGRNLGKTLDFLFLPPTFSSSIHVHLF